MDHKKLNKTRRNRGYAFESYLVHRLNRKPDWRGKRLGSPSVQLPDVMGVNDACSTIIAIEAKSSMQDLIYIPQDQIERCVGWVNMFGLYDNKVVVLAYKFGRIPANKTDGITSRKLKYIYKIFPYEILRPAEMRISYNGMCSIRQKNKNDDNKFEKVSLVDYDRNVL